MGSRATCEEYYGSSWAASNSLNQGSVRASYGSGSQTAALNVGGWGNYPGPLGRSECAEYDGTSWSRLSATCAQTIAAAACGKFGTSTAGIVFGGQPPHSNATEEWTRAATVRKADTS